MNLKPLRIFFKDIQMLLRLLKAMAGARRNDKKQRHIIPTDVDKMCLYKSNNNFYSATSTNNITGGTGFS